MDPGEALTTVSGVDVITAGPLPPNPAELIESQRMRKLIQWGEEHYDRVIIDTPPAAVVADAIPLVPMVSGVVIVVRLGHSHRDAVERLRTQLANVNAPVLGVVLNGSVSRRSEYDYGRHRPSSRRRPRRAPRAPLGRRRARASRAHRAAKPRAHGLTTQAPRFPARTSRASYPWSYIATSMRSVTSGPPWRSAAAIRLQPGSGRPPGGTTSARIVLS